LINWNNFITGGWNFNKDEEDFKQQFQILNIGILLSSISVIFGLIGNIFHNHFELMKIEASMLVISLILFFLLRYKKDFFHFCSIVLTTQFTTLFLFLIYNFPPETMKHLWIFTYPILILYFEIKYALLWISFMLFAILIAPFLPYVNIYYDLFQLFYLSFVLVIISLIVYFYKIKMEDAKNTISLQSEQLEQQLQELKSKDNMLSIQSKQAVMGEMISMIAHQWRQPLSTIILNISNLQLKKMLHQEISDEEMIKSLGDITDTIVYLSNTIDDFQTYFRPNNKPKICDINLVVTKAINFVLPRLKNKQIDIDYTNVANIDVEIYESELIQVILNILNNAIDELLEKNYKTPYVKISVEDKEQFITLSIKDNAGGIPKEHLDKIFEPYFSTKAKNGTGLGLYMSEMIIQK